MTKEEAIKVITEVMNNYHIDSMINQRIDEALSMAIEALKPEPIKHGRWIATEKGAKVTAYECSECGRVVWDDTGYDVSKDYPYCHCGAKMDEVEE